MPGPGPTRPKRRRNVRRWVLGSVLLLFTLLVAWAVTSYLAVSSGVETANDRLGAPARAALQPQDGSVLTNETHMLLLGTDSAPTAARRGLRHTDSIMLVRTDPGRNRVAYLSIPRDLRVEIPGHGFDKVNVAYQLGGAALAIRTIQGLGVPVNHVAIVDMARFKDLIDAVGGVDVDVPRPILSKFDCPLKTDAECASVARLALPQGRAAHGRTPRSHLRARAQEPAQPGRQRHLARRAPAAGPPGADEQDDELRNARPHAVGRATSWRSRLRPTCRRRSSSSSAGAASGPAATARCTAAWVGHRRASAT